MAKTVITFQIEEFIKKNYLKYPSRKIADKFGISKSAVLRCLKNNNLKVPKHIVDEWRKQNSNIKPYTQKEKQFIIDNIRDMSIKEIAKKLKRCNSKIRDVIKELDLQWIVDEKAENSRFKKGIVPFNKGKKMEDYMSAETLKKFKANQFKKNHIPHNALPDWEEVERKDKSGSVYLLIKIPGKRKLVLKHRYVWEKHNGKIPQGHNIIFKDNNTKNCSIENLKCISNEDLMLQNSIHNYPEDIKELIQLKGQITRQINKSRKNDNRIKKQAR